MSTYYVEAPITGKMVGHVEASSEEEAITRFLNTAFNCEVKLDEDNVFTEDIEAEEFELQEQVNRGNVCYSPIGEAFAEDVD